jgi:DNA repair exonuclease SbcCD ATPase subunit
MSLAHDLENITKQKERINKRIVELENKLSARSEAEFEKAQVGQSPEEKTIVYYRSQMEQRNRSTEMKISEMRVKRDAFEAKLDAEIDALRKRRDTYIEKMDEQITLLEKERESKNEWVEDQIREAEKRISNKPRTQAEIVLQKELDTLKNRKMDLDRTYNERIAEHDELKKIEDDTKRYIESYRQREAENFKRQQQQEYYYATLLEKHSQPSEPEPEPPRNTLHSTKSLMYVCQLCDYGLYGEKPIHGLCDKCIPKLKKTKVNGIPFYHHQIESDDNLWVMSPDGIPGRMAGWIDLEEKETIWLDWYKKDASK